MKIKRLLQLSEKQSYFLFGPRGTGKTTFLKKHFPQSTFINLLEKKTYLDLLANPDRLESLIVKDSKHVVIDEVQKIPELLDVVHRLIEEKKIHFILTGSSARKLRRSNANLLAGRAISMKMFPLTIKELNNSFELEKAVQFGFLPTLYDTQKEVIANEYLDSYVDTYLREEVTAEGLTKNLSGFVRFLEIASFSQGELINYSEIARESQISRKMVENYFTILEDLLIAYFLPVFSKRAKRKLVAHRKFYYFDVGVFQSLRPTGILDNVDNLIGASLETLVLQELLAINHYEKRKFQFFFWRSINGLEIDFILYNDKKLIAIEIKAKKNIDRKDFKALNEFKKDYQIAELYYLYQGNRQEKHGDINVLPIINFLKSF